MDHVHCSALLRRGRYASHWNAFLLVELVQFVRSTPPYTIGGLGQHAGNVIVPITVADPGFPRGGGANSQNCYYFAIFLPKTA